MAAMIEVLDFIFNDVWHFLGVAILLAIAIMWKPIEINILHDHKGGSNSGSKTG